MKNVWLHRYAVLWSFCTLFLVVAGGLVTSNDAGLSVPDWPLSYGRLMPPMEGNIFYEHGHRMVATTVGLLTIGMAVGLMRAERGRRHRHGAMGFTARSDASRRPRRAAPLRPGIARDHVSPGFPGHCGLYEPPRHRRRAAAHAYNGRVHCSARSGGRADHGGEC